MDQNIDRELETLERLLDEAFERNFEDALSREAGIIPEQLRGTPARLLAEVSRRLQVRR